MKKILILTLFIIAAQKSVAQNIIVGQSNIACRSSEAINNGNTLSISNEFIIRGSSEIEWLQNNGTDKTIYVVTGTSGSWEDLNEEGEMEFKVTLGTRTGKIRLARSASGALKLRIEMYRATVDLVPFDFVISSFEKLN